MNRILFFTLYIYLLNIEECNNVSRSKNFLFKPQYAPIDVKLEPDQREITVNKGEDLKVRCSARCHPKCDVNWEKDYQTLGASGLINLTENIFGKDLVIENISSSHEGLYVCLVKNIHGKAQKGFTLSVRETEDKALNISVEVVIGFVIVLAVIAILIVIIVIMYKKYHKKKNVSHRNRMSEESSPEGEGVYESIIDLHLNEMVSDNLRDQDYNISIELQQAVSLVVNERNARVESDYISMQQHQVVSVPENVRDEDDYIPMALNPGTSRNDEQIINQGSPTYDSLEFNTLNVWSIPDTEHGYTRLYKTGHRIPNWYWVLKRTEIAQEDFPNNTADTQNGT